MKSNKVFISYRRDLSKHLARSIYQDLVSHGWDVFLDVNTIDSGNFDRIILNEISERNHFILLISKGSLNRCINDDDWVRREIEEALRQNLNIVPIVEEDIILEDEFKYLPDHLKEQVSSKNALPLSHFYFDSAMEMLRTRFLKEPNYTNIELTTLSRKTKINSSHIQKNIQIRIEPSYIDWIAIPEKSYSISKYPIMNSQYAQFIASGGYDNSKWWTDTGWKLRINFGWQVPLKWHESDWNSPDQPVVGVSWFEAIAFCLWMTDQTSKQIILPTEDQWQYAAEGDNKLVYPWGNEWDSNRCHNSFGGRYGNAGTTVSVKQFENTGKSSFEIVDMAGNAWEWCLTDYNTNTNNLRSKSDLRVMKGGSWVNVSQSVYRCDFRGKSNPKDRTDYSGFRVVHS